MRFAARLLALLPECSLGDVGTGDDGATWVGDSRRETLGSGRTLGPSYLSSGCDKPWYAPEAIRHFPLRHGEVHDGAHCTGCLERVDSSAMGDRKRFRASNCLCHDTGAWHSGERSLLTNRGTSVELRDYSDIMRRRWLTAIVTALTVLALTSAITLLMPQKYTAATRLFFAVQGTESVTDLAQGSTFAEKQIASYAEVATSPIVLDPVIERFKLGTTAADLAESITATVPTDTVILEVSVVDADPKRATIIANAIGAELANVVSGLAPERQGGSEAVKATILKPAVIPVAPSSPNIVRNLALGCVLALILAIAAALIRDALDTKIRSDDDLRSITEAPVLGSIAFDETVPRHPIVIADEPHSAPSEAVRRLRTNLQFVGAATGSKSLVITSSVPGEGKTTTSINLAVALADAGNRVILIDADLRRPSVAEYMGLEGAAGLTTVLIGRADLADVIQPWRSNGLDILPSGQVPPNPSELLGSSAMGVLLQRLGDTYDVILLDSPPLLPVTDATILTKLAGGALVVVGADRIHRRPLEDALSTLDVANAHTYGLVLNKVAKRDAQSYSYSGSYYRSDPGTPVGGERQHEVTTVDDTQSDAGVSERELHAPSAAGVGGSDR